MYIYIYIHTCICIHIQTHKHTYRLVLANMLPSASGSPSTLWKPKEKVDELQGSSMEQCCEAVYCALERRGWLVD